MTFTSRRRQICPHGGGSAWPWVPLDLLTWWRFTLERAKSRDELALAQALGRLDGDDPVKSVPDIRPDELAGEPTADITGPQDEHVFVVGESTCDLIDESGEVFLAVSLQRILRRASTAVPDFRSVTEMSSRTMLRGDVRFEMPENGSAA